MIDVGSANARANELRSYANQLRSARTGLSQYKSMIGESWDGTEVLYYSSAVEKVQERSNQIAAELDSIANAISTTAAQIREREEAEERARREAEERARREAEAQAEVQATIQAVTAAAKARGRR